MEILDDQDRRGPRPQRIHEGVGDFVWSATTLHSRNHLLGEHRSDVDERTQRTRREQRVARARHDPDRARVRIAETANEGGLTDSRLAAEQDETSSSASHHRPEVLLQRVQLALPFEQYARTRRRLDRRLHIRHQRSPPRERLPQRTRDLSVKSCRLGETPEQHPR